MADWRLDQRTEETPAESDITILSRGTSTFKTTFKKIKEFIIGTTALTTTSDTVTGAIEEVKGIADNNTTQLNAMENERGYLNTKMITGLDLNDFSQSGYYAGANLINSPQDNVWFVIEVFNIDQYAVQRAMGFANGGTQTFERRKNLTTWTDWKRLDTSEITSIAFPYNTGYENCDATWESVLVKSNNTILLKIAVKKTDGTVFTEGGGDLIGTIPSGWGSLFAFSKYTGLTRESTVCAIIIENGMGVRVYPSTSTNEIHAIIPIIKGE